jgi:predicted RNA binding protein YcfA (HicA-like mRNA interferase family)
VPKFPIDAPRRKVLRALEKLGFEIVRDREHVALARKNADGTVTTMTLPGGSILNSGTLHRILAGTGISSREFIDAYYTD